MSASATLHLSPQAKKKHPLTMQDHQVLLLLFKGHPASGKSTLARHVCQQLRVPLVDKDDARDCLQHSLPPAARQLVDANALAYDIMFSYAGTQLSLGLSTAIDCPFARVELFDSAVELAQKHRATVAVVECGASNEAVWRQRLEARAAQQQEGAKQDHKPRTWQDMQQLLSRYDGCYRWTTDGSRAVPHLCSVDTTVDSVQQAGQRVLEFVQGLLATRPVPAGVAPV